MSTTPDKLVERYLKHLDVELDDLPRDRRREIVDEIDGHIAEARAGLESETEADVRNILEGLGDPADIATDARERFEVYPPTPSQTQFKPGAVEIGALVLLLVGGLILPLFGWVIGVVLLWISNAWNVRDKILGTLVIPGGLGIPIALLLFAGTGESVSCSPVRDLNSGTELASPGCPGGTSTPYLAIAGVVVLFLAPIVTTAYLAYRMRSQAVAAA